VRKSTDPEEVLLNALLFKEEKKRRKQTNTASPVSAEKVKKFKQMLAAGMTQGELADRIIAKHGMRRDEEEEAANSSPTLESEEESS